MLPWSEPFLLLPFAKCLFPLNSSFSLQRVIRHSTSSTPNFPYQSRLASALSKGAGLQWGPLGERVRQFCFSVFFLLWSLTCKIQAFPHFLKRTLNQASGGILLHSCLLPEHYYHLSVCVLLFICVTCFFWCWNPGIKCYHLL